MSDGVARGSLRGPPVPGHEAADDAARIERGERGERMLALQFVGMTIPISPADVEACVERLRDLIRIPSVNPPEGGPDVAAGRDPRGGETAVATHCAEELTAAGIAAEVIEAAPGRGSCFARLPATVADPEPPLVLLSHVDVVPVDAESWTRDPFGGELLDGVIWGRGAIDMKDMLAMELGVLLALHRSGAERRRDVILAAVADEEAGGEFGAEWMWEHHRDLIDAEYAINEGGGNPMTIAGHRVYGCQVAEKGSTHLRMTVTGYPEPHAADGVVLSNWEI